MNDAADNLAPTRSELVPLLERMLLIRRMEERLAADFKAGRLPGAVHLYIGQEAIAAGVCAHLTDDDAITSTHRGHGHFLAKGGDPGAMLAEIYGSGQGICRGMGGSMHVADVSKGMFGANGIVAAGIPIATGAAFAAQLDRSGRVAVAFFGDGASNHGAFMESLNIAALWRLPMVFMCENNGFSEFSPADTVTAGAIIDRARAFAMPCESVDGNDVIAVWRAAGAAVARARAGEGPSFIEAHTYRIHGHLEAEASFLKSAYRDPAEVEAWRAKDPIERMKAYLEGDRIVETSEIADIEARIAAVVAEAAAFAEAGAPADPHLPFELMFAPAGA
jgi:pyruvate dehydrogenase E1 component alpha subunit